MTAQRKIAEPLRPAALRRYPNAFWDGGCWRDGSFWYDERTADKAVAFFRNHLVFSEGEWAGRPFVLEEFQEHDIVRPLFGWKRGDSTRRYRRAFVWIARKNGKGLSLDTPLPTPSGWTTIGQLRVGDCLYDESGKECSVTFISDLHYLDCYEMSFSNGERIICDGDHRWLTTAHVNRVGRGSAGRKMWSKTRVRDTREILATLKSGSRGDRNHSLVMPAPICGRTASLPIDPYVFGLWLGDGSSNYAAITVGEIDRDELAANIAAAGVPVWLSKPKKGSAWLVHLTERKFQGGRNDCVQSRLRQLGVLGSKRIPSLYQRASAEQRLALLQGLMDSDGYAADHGKVLEISTVSELFGDDLAELLAGLGIKFSRRIVPMRCNGRPVEGRAHRFQFCVARDVLAVFRLKRKLARQKASAGRSRTVQIVDVRSIPTVPTRCIQVDSVSRLFRCGRTMLPTHNTELAAGIALLALLGDAEPGGQVFSIASEKDQASIVFNKASNMVARAPHLANRLECLKETIYCPALNASFRPLSGKPKGKHGLSMSGLVGDEIHEWPGADLYNFVHDSAASRRQPLEFLISTAGQKGTHGEEVFKECQAIAAGDIDDPETLVLIYAPDADDDWTKETTWRKANPNFGKSVKTEPFLADFSRARQLPRLENDFKRYRLNIWTEQAVKWLPIDAVDDQGRHYGWDHCVGALPWKDEGKTPAESRFEQRLVGKKCWGGLDLSSTNDLSGLGWWFPIQEGLDRPAALVRAFKPADLIKMHAKRDRIPYDKMVEEGSLFTTPGNVVDYSFIQEQIYKDAERFKIAHMGDINRKEGQGGLAIDRWNATETATKLMQEGLPVVLFGQGFASMSAPSKELERLVMANAFDHGGHPLFRRHAQAVAVESDAVDNIKPAKDKSSIRIDLIVAIVQAIGIAGKGEPPPPQYQVLFI